MHKVKIVCAEEVTVKVATKEKTEDGYPVMEERKQPCGELVDIVEIEDHVEDEGEKLVHGITQGKVKGRPKDIPCAAGHVGKVVEA